MWTYNVKMWHDIFFNFLLSPRFRERELEAESRTFTLANFYVENDLIFLVEKSKRVSQLVLENF